MKYKRIIAEVMLGSFVVQLFGLVTPLFTQVILDKVIVHRSMSTLDVLGIAFVAVSIFEFLLNLTRNYIFIHTANKLMQNWEQNFFIIFLHCRLYILSREKSGILFQE